jgi:hypothetical protein
MFWQVVIFRGFSTKWSLKYSFFPMAQQPLGGQGLLSFRGFTITHFRHTTLCRTPLDEWSARRRDLYLTTHNTYKRQTSMLPAGFEPTIPVSERPQTHVLDRVATGIGLIYVTYVLSSEFVACYVECDKIHRVYNIKTDLHIEMFGDVLGCLVGWSSGVVGYWVDWLVLSWLIWWFALWVRYWVGWLVGWLVISSLLVCYSLSIGKYDLLKDCNAFETSASL